jgi:hypothetical protein
MDNRHKMAVINKLYAMLKKPTAQIAHLVFADTQANAEKTKRAIFCQRSTKKKKIEPEKKNN